MKEASRPCDGTSAKYVAPKREVFFRLETLPGEQAQVDWAHFGKVHVGNAMCTLSCFVMVLGHSRAMFARFFFDQTTG